MSTFKILGGKSLKGEVKPQGAKNEALQILCAVLLTEEETTIQNVPDIKDVNLLIDLLKGMGVSVEKVNETTYKFKSENIDLSYTRTEDFFKKKTLKDFLPKRFRNLLKRLLSKLFPLYVGYLKK